MKVKSNRIKLLKIFLVFNLVSLLWIFFRASSLGDAFHIFAHLLDFSSGVPFTKLGLNLFELLLAFFAVVLLFCLEKFGGTEENLESKFLKLSEGRRIAVYYSVVLSLILFGKFSRQQFIYFQF